MKTRAARPAIVPPDPGGERRPRTKVVDGIIEALRQDIVTRRLPDGGRLPNERDLSERYGVSQPTIREAIRAVETLGLVEVVHGSGTFVRSQGDYALASALQTILQIERVGILEVLDVRHVLGRHSVERAARHASDADVEAIEVAYRRCADMSDARSVEAVIDHIIHFQHAVSAASHNPLLHSLEVILMVLLIEVQVNALSSRGIRFWRARANEFQPFRAEILAGIRARSPVEARLAIDHYFAAQRSRFEQDSGLRSLNLSNPKLISVVSSLVRQFKA